MAMAAPKANSPSAEQTALAVTIAEDGAKNIGNAGIIAPSKNTRNDAVAAPMAEPPKSSGLMPSSSRARVSSAEAGS